MKRISTIVTPAAILPVSLNKVKEHCRITFDEDDQILEWYLESAVSNIEHHLQRKLITQTWKMFLDTWPTYFKILFGDLQSVTHIKYTDIDDSQETFSSDNYYVDTNSIPGRVLLKYGESWPDATLRVNNPIEIQFVTGYGDETTDIPFDIKNAILLLTQHFYENRENYLVSEFKNYSVTKIPMTADALLANYRIWDWVI